MKRLMMWLLVSFGLTGCSLIDDVVNPGDGYLKLSIQGPPGVSVSVTVQNGAQPVDRLTDDGRGFEKLLTLKPGKYSIVASPASGYTAYVAVTEAKGNSTQADQHVVAVARDAVSQAIVSYVAKTPAAP